MDVQILEDIGLTNAEIKVYLALLELGSSTAGPIIEQSNLQSSVVHTTLGKLFQKGFVSSIMEGKRHHYQASNPKHILDYIQEKRERLERILPELNAKQLTAKRKPEVITYRGIRGIKELMLELLDAGGTEHHTIGSCEASLMLGSEWWIRYHEKRKTKSIRAKLLFNNSLKKWATSNYFELAELRFTSAGFEPLTETIIRNDKVAILIWSKIPLGIIIHQREAADSYEAYFQALWKTAS